MKNSLNEAFRVIIASDQVHKNVVAEIYYGDKFVLLISQDNEIPVIEIPGIGLNESVISRVVPYKQLLDALVIAIERLNEPGSVG